MKNTSVQLSGRELNEILFVTNSTRNKMPSFQDSSGFKEAKNHIKYLNIRGVSKKFGEWSDISKATWARCARMHMAIQRYIEKRHLV
jgi:hypothetical protein